MVLGICGYFLLFQYLKNTGHLRQLILSISLDNFRRGSSDFEQPTNPSDRADQIGTCPDASWNLSPSVHGGHQSWHISSPTHPVPQTRLSCPLGLPANLGRRCCGEELEHGELCQLARQRRRLMCRCRPSALQVSDCPEDETPITGASIPGDE